MISYSDADLAAWPVVLVSGIFYFSDVYAPDMLANVVGSWKKKIRFTD